MQIDRVPIKTREFNPDVIPTKPKSTVTKSDLTSYIQYINKIPFK